MRNFGLTTRQLMVLVAATAAWLAFVARTERLRTVAATHMRQFEDRTRVLRVEERARPVEEQRADAVAAWHLKMATEYNIEADFVEAFQVALLLALLGLGVTLFLRNRRIRAAPVCGRTADASVPSDAVDARARAVGWLSRRRS
jgi:hypothetical protein